MWEREVEGGGRFCFFLSFAFGLLACLLAFGSTWGIRSLAVRTFCLTRSDLVSFVSMRHGRIYVNREKNRKRGPN